MTNAIKLRMYRDHLYYFTVPPVCHASWTEQDWITFIDKHGVWYK